jgi:hypothetical protein
VAHGLLAEFGFELRDDQNPPGRRQPSVALIEFGKNLAPRSALAAARLIKRPVD